MFNLNFKCYREIGGNLYDMYDTISGIKAIENCGFCSMDALPLYNRICGIKGKLQCTIQFNSIIFIFDTE